MDTPARYLVIGALNLALALTISQLAPAEPRLSDRDAYDYVAARPFAPNCPFSIYCYRVLVPAVVSRLPLDPDTSWRAYQVGANAAAGTIIALAASAISAGASAPLLASVIAQTSYGFTFTAYDPYAADPMVFLIAALLTWCWIHDRMWPALVLSSVGVFAKETVALIAISFAIAACFDRRPGWRRWLLPALVSGTVLAAFHVISRVWLQWEIASNPAAQSQHGWWIGLWWRNNPFLERKVYMVFATFGFAWAFAALGCRTAPAAWRGLAIGTLCALAPLLIVQTPERALGNAFYVIIPLAVSFAAPAPILGSVAIGLNALITAKAGSSSPWLPSARVTLILAAAAAVALIFKRVRRAPRAPLP